MARGTKLAHWDLLFSPQVRLVALFTDVSIKFKFYWGNIKIANRKCWFFKDPVDKIAHKINGKDYNKEKISLGHGYVHVKIKDLC